MARIDTARTTTKRLLSDVRDAIKALEKARGEHDTSEQSMYKYCKTHDALIRAETNLHDAFAALGVWLYRML